MSEMSGDVPDASNGSRRSARKLTNPMVALIALAVSLAALAVAWNIGTHPGGVQDRLLKVFGRLYQQTFSHGNAIFLLAIGLTLAVEVVVTGYSASSIRRLIRPSKSAITDWFCLVLALTGLGGVLTFIFSLGLASLVSDRLAALVPHGVLAAGNPVLQFFWLWVVNDFVRYWVHYLQHKLPFWWEVHKFHHAATELNIITTARGHPFQGAFDLVVIAIPTALFDGTAAQFTLLSMLFTFHGGVNHSMLAWRWGWLGRWIVNSPVNHRIHHSPLSEHFDRNFAASFVLWDRLFGTYYRGDVLNQTVGVANNEYNRRGVVYDLYLGLKLSVTQLLIAPARCLSVARRITNP